MNTIGREVIGRCDYGLLVADNKHPLDVCHVTLAAGAKHKKGEVLEKLESGKCDILGTTALGASGDDVESGTAVASYILAENVDAESGDVTAAAYRSGSFIRNAVIVKEGYSLAEEDEAKLRTVGIYLSDAMIG
ncbi:head decoration protein [Lachnospiraceae bacterium]|jgi:hypothetical protein|nr:head decoration protein [Lachnospiraceae bacterium]